MSIAWGLNLRKYFRRIPDGSNDGPSLFALLGASLEESVCGADSWGLFGGLLEAGY